MSPSNHSLGGSQSPLHHSSHLNGGGGGPTISSSYYEHIKYSNWAKLFLRSKELLFTVNNQRAALWYTELICIEKKSIYLTQYLRYNLKNV